MPVSDNAPAVRKLIDDNLAGLDWIPLGHAGQALSDAERITTGLELESLGINLDLAWIKTKNCFIHIVEMICINRPRACIRQIYYAILIERSFGRMQPGCVAIHRALTIQRIIEFQLFMSGGRL